MPLTNDRPAPEPPPEIYRRHRPERLEDVVGQDAAVSVLRGYLLRGAVPHFVMLTGPSGCGKTTIARILRHHLNVRDNDYSEMNAADFRGIDTVRAIRAAMPYAPIGGGGARMWYFDEAHKLTSDAQNALLKMLEDPPAHAYFVMATTEPNKVIATVRGRASEIRLAAVPAAAVAALVADVAKREKIRLADGVAAKIADAADGNARRALVLLEQVGQLEAGADQGEHVEKAAVKHAAIELARALVAQKPEWPKIARVLADVDGEDAEELRRMVLRYARAIVLKNGNRGLGPRAYQILQVFRDDVFNSGHAGLAAMCYEVAFPPRG